MKFVRNGVSGTFQAYEELVEKKILQSEVIRLSRKLPVSESYDWNIVCVCGGVRTDGNAVGEAGVAETKGLLIYGE